MNAHIRCRAIFMCLTVLMCICLLATSEAMSQMRTWKGRSQRLQVVAEYVETVGDSVRLRTPDGKIITWRMALLSDADRAYLANLAQTPADVPEQEGLGLRERLGPDAQEFLIRGGQSRDFPVRLEGPSVVQAEVRWRGLVRELQLAVRGRQGAEWGRTTLERRSADTGTGTLRVEIGADKLPAAGADIVVRITNPSRGTALGALRLSVTPLLTPPPDDEPLIVDPADPSIVELRLAATRPLRRGALATMKNARVQVGPATERSLAEVVAGIARTHEGLGRQLQAAHLQRGVLAAAPQFRNEVLEFPDAYVVTWTASANVADPQRTSS